MQTPVYALYQVPTIVSAAILLTTRYLGISLPSQWWELFDSEWEDVWDVCGHVIRLYRPRTHEEKVLVDRLVARQEVKKWLEEKAQSQNSKDHPP
jgi:cyclin L